MNMNTRYAEHSPALLCLLNIPNVSCFTVPDCRYRWSYDTELTGVHGRGHRAQLNLWTKRCSLLMTQWDLPVRACSMPAAVSADAQLSGKKRCDPNNTKGVQPERSPSCSYSLLKPLCLPQTLMRLLGDRREKERWCQRGPLFTVSQCAPSCG